MNLSKMNERFSADGAIVFQAGPGGLPMAVITADGGQARVVLHGAHVTHYQPSGQRPVLWMSAKSWFEAGRPIRGGVPICFPWFSQSSHVPNAPGHGIVRLRQWEVESAGRLGDGRVQLVLQTQSNGSAEPMWQWDYSLKFAVTVGPTLAMTLTAANTDTRPQTITEALHTYFAVSDVRNVKVRGLEDVAYVETAGGTHQPTGPQGGPITFAGEVDRGYFGTGAAVEIEDPGLGRRILIEKSGSRSTVVWNPWTAKAERMPDFGDDEWPEMLCVETANAGPDAVVLQPGQSHAMEARISVRAK